MVIALAMAIVGAMVRGLVTLVVVMAQFGGLIRIARVMVSMFFMDMSFVGMSFVGMSFVGMSFMGMSFVNRSVAVVVRLMVVRLVAMGVILAVIRAAALDHATLDALALAATTRVAVARAAAVGTILGFLLGLAMGALIGFDQCLAVGDRDLIIVGMDFAEGQEAMAVAAILDEGRLQRRLYARDLGEVDVSTKLFALGGLEVKLFDSIAADHNDPGLFRVGSVDQHFVGHF
jgi:hypothetical protein